MSFLAPLWLGLAAAVAVPLLLHLRQRPLTRRLDFPAVRWLRRAEREHERELKLRNLLLMLLRTAIVLLLAAAAARPLGPGTAGSHAPTALAIVLDNSLSTTRLVDGEPVLARLRRAAASAARAATADDRVWLITADGAVQGGTPPQVAAAIEAVPALAGGGDLASAVARAATLVATSGALAPRVAIATDGQATAWADGAAAAGVDVLVLVPEVGGGQGNRAVVAAEPDPPRWAPRGALTVRVRGDSLPVRVVLAGRTLARGTAAGDAPLRITAAPAERGWVAGSAEIAPDELRGDDVRHFAVWVGVAPGIAVDPSAGAFARAAADALVADGRARAAGAADAVTIASPEAAPRRPALLVAPRDPARRAAANAALARLGVPWRFAAPAAGEAVVRGEAPLDGRRVRLRYPLERTAAGDAGRTDTLATAAGEPWVVAGDGYVLVASPLDTLAGDLVLAAGFAPWIGDVVTARLAGDGGPIVAAAPGGTVRLPAGTTGLEAPDGTVRPVVARTTDVPAEPGVYFARRDGARIGAVVVNPDARESDMTALTAPAVAARIAARSSVATTDVAQWRDGAFGTRGRTSLLGPALAAALLLLAVESLAARRGAHA